MNFFTKISFLLLIIGFSLSTCSSQVLTPVAVNGRLNIKGSKLINKSGEVVQLKGMSLFWSQWQPQFYNFETISQLKNKWKVNVVRAAMAIENNGYLTNPSFEQEKIYKVIDAAIELGIYVIVDWHDHHAEKHQQQSIKFFSEVSKKYGNHPNIIYEIYNEPLDVSWTKVLKPYHLAVIAAIRKNDPENIIVCGTPNWSQKLLEAAEDRINEKNIAYTLHFYAGTHKKKLRDEAQKAIDLGLPIFVTEFGITDASGDGAIDLASTKLWFDLMNRNKLSWCNWSIADKKEESAALLPGTKPNQLDNKNVLTSSGKFMKAKLNE